MYLIWVFFSIYIHDNKIRSAFTTMVAEIMLFIDIRTHRRDLVVKGNVTQFLLISNTLVVRGELKNRRALRIRRKRMSHVLMMLR